MTVSFIDAHRGVHGVEPICRQLQIAPSSYWLHTARRADPAKRPARAQRDAVLRPEIERAWAENHRVYGAKKVWKQLQREQCAVARCTVARLMRQLGIAGVVRGKGTSGQLRDSAPYPSGRVA